jgi:pilus assembly protein Flp/PilA
MNALIPVYVKLRSRLESALDNEKGATMVEYALLAALIAAFLVGGITAMRDGINTTFGTVTAAL